MIRVLCLDDEESFLEVEKEFLERSGRLCIERATSAPEALQRLKDEPFDAIISDYHMIKMEGIEFLKTVRSTSQIPFILFTGKGKEERVIEALNSGADFYAKKEDNLRSQFTSLRIQ